MLMVGYVTFAENSHHAESVGGGQVSLGWFSSACQYSLIRMVLQCLPV